MARVVIAMLWLVVAGSAHAAYYRGTLTFDDGRTATLTVSRFGWAGSTANGHRAAKVRCTGDACFASTAVLGLYYHPIEYSLGYGELNIPPAGQGKYYCTTQDAGLGVPRSCRIASRVVCGFWSPDGLTHIPDIATGMLELHRTASSCRGVSSRVPPGSGGR